MILWFLWYIHKHCIPSIGKTSTNTYVIVESITSGAVDIGTKNEKQGENQSVG